MVTTVLALALVLILAGCSKKAAQDAGESAMLLVAAAPVIPLAIVTFPFWKAATYDPVDRMSRDAVISEYGQPIAKYTCGNSEVWEYDKGRIPVGKRFVVFATSSVEKVNYSRRKIDLLNECRLASGTPAAETMDALYATALPCGKQYIKQTTERQRFFIEMERTGGAVAIEYYHIDGDQFTNFEIYYEGAQIFVRPEVVAGQSHTMQTAVVRYGPGTSTLLEIRITGLTPQAFKLTVGCPQL